MPTYNISIEGQTIPVPEEIGSSDDAVKQALAPFYPDAANAMITRTEKDDVVTVNVVKRAGTKGHNPLDILRVCPGGRNPAIELYEEIGLNTDGVIDPEKALEISDVIDKALQDGLEQHTGVINACGRLQAARPRPSPFVPIGF